MRVPEVTRNYNEEPSALPDAGYGRRRGRKGGGAAATLVARGGGSGGGRSGRAATGAAAAAAGAGAGPGGPSTERPGSSAHPGGWLVSLGTNYLRGSATWQCRCGLRENFAPWRLVSFGTSGLLRRAPCQGCMPGTLACALAFKKFCSFKSTLAHLGLSRLTRQPEPMASSGACKWSAASLGDLLAVCESTVSS